MTHPLSPHPIISVHISLLTASGKHNLGDELILAEEFRRLKSGFPEATFSLFTYDTSSLIFSDSNAKIVSFFPNKFRSHPWANISYFFKNIWHISKSDLIVIGGGGLIYDTETQTNMLPANQWKFRVFLAKLFKKTILWWGVGINLKHTDPKRVRFLFSGKRTIVTVRDINSQKILSKIGIQSQILPDVVF